MSDKIKDENENLTEKLYEIVGIYNLIKDQFDGFKNINDIDALKSIFKVGFIKMPGCNPDAYYFSMDLDKNITIFDTDFEKEHWGDHIIVNEKNKQRVEEILLSFGGKIFDKETFLKKSLEKLVEIISIKELIDKFRFKDNSQKEKFLKILMKEKFIIDFNYKKELEKNIKKEIKEIDFKSLYKGINHINNSTQKLDYIFVQKIFFDIENNTGTTCYDEEEEDYYKNKGFVEELILNRDTNEIISKKLIPVLEFLEYKLSSFLDYNKDYSYTFDNFENLNVNTNFSNNNINSNENKIRFLEFINILGYKYSLQKTNNKGEVHFNLVKYSNIKYGIDIILNDFKLENLSISNMIALCIVDFFKNSSGYNTKQSIVKNLGENEYISLNTLFE